MEKDTYENITIESLQRIDHSLDVSADYLRGIERWLFVIAVCTTICLLITIYALFKAIS